MLKPRLSPDLAIYLFANQIIFTFAIKRNVKIVLPVML